MTHSDNPFTEIPKKLYQALNDRDYKSMWKLYAMDATFSDPAYGSLKGDEIKAMWHQICVRNTDLEAEILSVTQNDAQTISYSWKASYTHAI